MEGRRGVVKKMKKIKLPTRQFLKIGLFYVGIIMNQ